MDARRKRAMVGRHVIVSAYACDRGAVDDDTREAELLDVVGTYTTRAEVIAAARSYARNHSALPMVVVVVAYERHDADRRPGLWLWRGRVDGQRP